MSLLQALLRPRSVALVGVSDDSAKTAARPLRFLRQAGWGGRIFNVNAARDRVQGEPAFRSLRDLPERPDHAFVLAGADAAIAAVQDCAALRIPVATVLASGFAEAGPEGLQRQQALLDAARGGGVRLLGPSSLGVVQVAERLVLTANAAFAEPGLPAGQVFCISHSGSLIGALVSRAKARGLGFHSLVSVGSEADLSIGEIGLAALEDPGVGGFLLFLESLHHADRLEAFALAAARAGKPVVAYKLGRSAVAAQLAQGHTGALAGEDAVADAFLRDLGIARVDTLEGLIEAMPLLQRLPLGPHRARPRVGVVTTTGGGAAMVVDQLGVRGIDVVGPSAALHRRLAGAGVAVQPGTIVDLTLAGTRYEVMKATLDAMQASGEFDLVLATVGSSARTQPELAVQPVLDAAVGATPLAAFLVPEAPDALRRLADAGVAGFRTPEGCADAVAAAFRRRVPAPRTRPGHEPGPGHPLDEAQAYRLLAGLGLPHAPFVELAVGTDVPAALPMPWPVAVKLLDADVAHKSDIGGVRLGIGDRDTLTAAIASMRAAVAQHEPGRRVQRVLVQAMQQGVGELLMAYRCDADAGPVVIVAAGGVHTEVMADAQVRLAPVGVDEAREMIAALRCARLFQGFRGRPPGDLQAAAQALAALSRLATRADLRVLEAEINPLIVGERGIAAVDAVVRVSGPSAAVR